ncbi:Hsp20/alpha crystallin family protein [Lactiplantibacillus mudanjiangensis]|uniref:Small heat shock protein [Lactobacillus plantarum JDM1] n=1 Tax=Lactiplantibacillus mudanjiangensis TaxID=1296538 RepID=A0A660E6U0_9LACO|nr:Hsp20/alpha crystallin family protein [Lactiplantibacillus mudanjiangensis]VDG21346.1 small heat shock protein [Lactobacillus plantarum JDM1] [Lactiplantibacillus mudanjiangensis]VDG23575.1 small heat shock protein [Lactobacillus plantarum JDM1] [Lactiplantibacillus mudanjiangensis]VDG28807.1 small heat shock protein [Lactobacillus plantarum JDM1] [Lactiplantibacillus mudanjiangensis]VDG32180.1 small heat shock protein [Lactobacillus plantarum JDM1] [Lactiplantibacillus mudanjiangensis]
MANDMMDNWHKDLFERLNPLDSKTAATVFNDLGQSLSAVTGRDGALLRTDIQETDDQYQLQIDLPGVEKSDITLKYRDGRLSVGVKRNGLDDDADVTVLANERATGTFNRQYSLADVAADKIEAHYENGVLALVLPKKAAADTHHIEIQ